MYYGAYVGARISSVLGPVGAATGLLIGSIIAGTWGVCQRGYN